MFWDYFVKKYTKQVIGEFNEGKDPFTEEYEYERKSFLSGTTKVVKRKREKTIHEYIPEKEQKLIRYMRRRSYRMELMFSFWGMKFGWINIVKLLPVVGDICSLILALVMFNNIRKLVGDMPTDLQTRCIFTILVDFGFGLVPIVGDVVSMAYKPNCRNAMMVEDFLDSKFRKLKNVQEGSLRLGTPLSTKNNVNAL